MKKNIEYTDESWNAISGCIPTDCAVKEHISKCWAEKMADRLKGRYGYDIKNPFKPTFHKDQINKPLHWKKPRRVVCCFMGDIAYAEYDWIKQVLDIIKKTPQHRYYILTKKPSALLQYKFPNNTWVGVTINRKKDLYRFEDLLHIHSMVKYISFEPIYESLDLLEEKYEMINDKFWIIIGAQTNPEFQPEKKWVDNIVNFARINNIPVFMKDNLRYEPKTYNFPKI